jgi:hypothetical protein
MCVRREIWISFQFPDLGCYWSCIGGDAYNKDKKVYGIGYEVGLGEGI